MEYLATIAAYVIASLGLAALVVAAAYAWYFALNRVYVSIKGSYLFYEFFIYRKEFRRWYKENNPRKRRIRPWTN